MKKLRLLCLLILISVIALPSVALAIDDPNTAPAINEVLVYDNLPEVGGIGVLIDYFLDYDPAPGIPTEPVSEAYIAVFVDTDGITQLKSVAPYAFDSNGYGRGAVWIEFSAAEVTLYGLTSTDIADYRIWLVGNPTIASGWVGDPPKTTAIIDEWHSATTAAAAGALLALDVLDYARLLGLAWTETLEETTALGNRLTAMGESYFENVIQNLRDLAPTAFSSGMIAPVLEDIDFATEYGAVATSGALCIVAGSPDDIVEGGDVITVGGALGTFTITLQAGTEGTITDLVGSITLSPSDLVAGDNVITATGLGTLTVDVELVTTQTILTDTVTGTGFDATDTATDFGMSRLMFSSLLWFGLSIIICASAYAGTRKLNVFRPSSSGPGNSVMLLFAICLIGGALLGLLDMRVAAMLVIAYAAFIGYVLFFRTSADIGRTVMFMAWMWFIVCLVGGTMVGSVPQASTVLTADITAATTPIPVESTAGFKAPGFIIIDDERISFSELTATEFDGTAWRPVARGSQDTTATVHTEGTAVRSVTGALLNNSLNYNIALLTDASGIMSFVAMPLVVWNIVTSFIFLPLSFLGSDMVILTYIWAIIGLGLLISIMISLAGGRKMA